MRVKVEPPYSGGLRSKGDGPRGRYLRLAWGVTILVFCVCVAMPAARAQTSDRSGHRLRGRPRS
jgi:hypothetical protein